MKTLISALLLALAITSVNAAIITVSETVWEISDGGNGHTYTLFEDSGTTMNWPTARDAARNVYGTELVSITSVVENAFVFDLFSDAGASGGHIGGSDEGSEGAFYWLDGDPFTYSNWRPFGGEPNNNGVSGNTGGENFITMVASGEWNDINDSTTTRYAIAETVPEPATAGAIVGLATLLISRVSRRR